MTRAVLRLCTASASKVRLQHMIIAARNDELIIFSSILSALPAFSGRIRGNGRIVDIDTMKGERVDTKTSLSMIENAGLIGLTKIKLMIRCR